MTRGLQVLLVLFAAFVASAGASYASPMVEDKEESRNQPAQDRNADQAAAKRRAARTRWEKLSPAERERMRARFENLKRMSPAERERVTAQANRLNEMRRRLWKSLDAKTRGRLDKLGNEKRLQLLDEMLADEVEGTAQRIIARMPEKDRERLKAARPVDRVRFLTERKRREDQESDELLRRIATEVGVRPPDVPGYRDLPPAQRRAKMREMLRARIIRNVDAGELPVGVDRAGWQRIQALPGEEFFHAIARLRRSHPAFGSGPGSVSAGSPRAKLRHALRGRPADRVELSDLTPEERQSSMMSNRRARVLEVIRTERLLPPERIRELESVPNQRFFRIVRGLASEPRPAERGGQREKPRRGGG